MSTVLILVFFTFVQIVELVYAIYELHPSPVFGLLQPFAFLGLICWWLRKDSLRTGVSWPLDTGMFLYVGWFLILPYYLIKTRGLRGLVDILLFTLAVLLLWVIVSLTLLGLADNSAFQN